MHQEATTTALEIEHTGGDAAQSVSSSGESESLLIKCLLAHFQYSSSALDEERAVESCIKGLPQFIQYDKLDINYQGENIHALFNEDATHIGPIGQVDPSTFRDRRGKVYNVINLDASHRTSGDDDVVVVVAWKVNLKDNFGLLQVLSFEEYILHLENRLECMLLLLYTINYK